MNSQGKFHGLHMANCDESAFQRSIFERTLHKARTKTTGVLASLVHKIIPFTPSLGVRRRQTKHLWLQPISHQLETWLTRLESDRGQFRTLTDSLRANCQDVSKVSPGRNPLSAFLLPRLVTVLLRSPTLAAQGVNIYTYLVLAPPRYRCDGFTALIY